MDTTITDPPEGRHQAFFYGWTIVCAAFAANFMGAGLGFYIFNAFLEPLTRLHGWSRTDIDLGPMLGYIVSVIAGLLYGSIVKQVGTRLIMSLSSIVTALSFYFLGVSGNLALFYLFYMLMMMGIGGMNGIVSSTAINNWFILKRGRAMGISTAAISLSGVVLAPAAILIMNAYGIEKAFLVISISIALVAPLAWILVRDRPEDMGLLPDGVNPAGNARGACDLIASRNGIDASHWTMTMSVRNANFWKIGTAYGLSMASVLGVMYQLKPRFSDIGFDSGTAVALMSGTALAGAFGKYAWSHLCDHMGTRSVAAILMACNAAGLGLMFSVNTLTGAVIFVLFYGFAMGGVVSTQPVIIADYFGRDAYPSIARYIGVVVGIDCIGYPIMGGSFDLTGSYNAGYITFIVFNCIAAILVFSLKKIL